MLIKAKFNKKRCEIRTSPTYASNIITTLSKTDTIYTISKLNNGFMYVNELNGWCEVSDLEFTQVISSDGFINSNDSTSQTVDKKQLSTIDIINLINNSKYNKIFSDKIQFIINNNVYSLDEYLKNMTDELNKYKNNFDINVNNIIDEIDKLKQTSATKETTSNIQQQVNNLVLGAVGDGNNAEVVQARGKFETLNNRLDSNDNEVGALVDVLSNVVSYKISGDLVESGIINDDGELADSNSYCRFKEFMPVIELKELSYSCTDNDSINCYVRAVYYDSDKAFISASDYQQANVKTIEFKVPNNVYFYKLCFKWCNTAYFSSHVCTVFARIMMNVSEKFNSTLENKYTKKDTRPVVTFVDDDGLKSFSRIKAILDAYNYKCNIGIITNNVGDRNSMSLEELKQLQTDGFEIVSHSKTHDGGIWFTSGSSYIFNRKSLITEVEDSYDFMCDNGFNSEIIVYPYGRFTENTETRIKKIANTCFNYGIDAKMNDHGVNDNMLFPRQFVMDSYGINYYKKLVDNCISEKGWLILGSHSGETENLTDSFYKQVVDYVNSKNITVLTLSSAIKEKANCLNIGIYGDGNSAIITQNSEIKY